MQMFNKSESLSDLQTLLIQMKGWSLISLPRLLGGEKKERSWKTEMRDGEIETNVCENTGLYSEPYQLQISN